MKRVKICGLTRYEDALMALEHGAWALGFIFYDKSPRHIEVEDAAKILKKLESARPALLNSALRTGVFVDADLQTLTTAVSMGNLNALQLHGHETPAFCEQVKTSLQGVKVFKALRPQSEKDVEHAQEFSACDAILLDTFSPNRLGGSGLTSNWILAKTLTRFSQPVILSGGLNSENIKEASVQVNPYAFDLSSGVEQVPGLKSPIKMHQLFEVLRSLQ